MQLSNAIRAHISEFGVVAPAGRLGGNRLLEVVADTGDDRIPEDARLCLQMLAAQLDVVKRQILENYRRVLASARRTELGRRLTEIPGVGPLLASAFVASVADPTVFRTGRDLAGLVPKQNSSGGKDRLGSIMRAGNRYLRQMLVVGAMAVIRCAQRNGTRRPWLRTAKTPCQRRAVHTRPKCCRSSLQLGSPAERQEMGRVGRPGFRRRRCVSRHSLRRATFLLTRFRPLSSLKRTGIRTIRCDTCGQGRLTQLWPTTAVRGATPQ